jgi:hypothetical protein
MLGRLPGGPNLRAREAMVGRREERVHLKVLAERSQTPSHLGSEENKEGGRSQGNLPYVSRPDK